LAGRGRGVRRIEDDDFVATASGKKRIGGGFLFVAIDGILEGGHGPEPHAGIPINGDELAETGRLGGDKFDLKAGRQREGKPLFLGRARAGGDRVVGNVAWRRRRRFGRAQESDLASRLRRKNTLSLQNVALPDAITSGLYDTPNVRSLTFRENYTNAAATIDGIYLLANSVWACVDGGTDADVAATLLSHKSFGANWNGAVTVNVANPASGQTYPVKFDRPTQKPVKARVTVRNLSALTDVQAAVRAAIVGYATGQQEGEAGFVVGASVSSFELAAAINRAAPGLYVQNCEISLVSPTSWLVGQIAIALNEIASIVAGDVEVIIV